MNKKISLLLATITACTWFSSCAIGGISDGTRENNICVWGAYSDAKVIQDPSYDYHHTKFSASFEVQLPKGECESDQIIVNPAHDVDYYELITTDLLSSSGDIFPKENISVYHQWYMEILTKSKNGTANADAYPQGSWVPDGLIPQAYSIEAEENSIEQGNNQGITVDFKATSSQPAGVYTGTFTLKIDKVERQIPVSVTVWDYDNSEVHGWNYWDLVNGFSAAGEMDNVEDWETIYYNQLLEYRITGYLPNADKADDPQTMINLMLQYWGQEGFNGFFIPDCAGNREKLYSYLKAVAEQSVKDGINYVAKVAYYQASVDEPWNGETLLEGAKNYSIQFTEVCKTISQEILSDSRIEDEDFRVSLSNSMLTVPQLVTAYYDTDERLPGNVTTFCPTINDYQTTGARQDYDYNAEITNGNKAVYTCLDPIFPYPSYHIDDYTIGGRVIGWMRGAYGLESYLMWASNVYIYQYYGKYYRDDPYKTSIHLKSDNISFANGDGCLYYPGAKYGVKELIPSIRLLAQRDSQEDYDSICVFENAYSNLCELYGLNSEKYTVANVMEGLYDSLFYGATYYVDESLIQEARERLANMIVAAKSDAKLLVNQTRVENTKVNIEIFSAAEEVYINGIKLTGTSVNGGTRYNRVFDVSSGLSKITVQCVVNGRKYETIYDLYSSQTILMTKEDITSDSYSLTKNSTFDADSKMFTICSWGETNIEQMINTPSLTIKFKDVLDLSQKTQIGFELENYSDYRISFDIYLVSTDGSIYFLDDLRLKVGEKYSYECDWLQSLEDICLNEIAAVRFEFKNLDSDNALLPDRRIVINNIKYA